MKRKWFYYMLGRLICGDDCIAQTFSNCKATNRFRYQIQAKDYNEGILWGKICARNVFGTKNIEEFGRKLAQYINERSYVSIRRPKYPQCEIKIYVTL